METRSTIRWQIIIFICGIIFMSFVTFFTVVRQILIEDYRKLMVENEKQMGQIISEKISRTIEREIIEARMEAQNKGSDKVEGIEISSAHYENEKVGITYVQGKKAEVSLEEVREYVKKYALEKGVEVYVIDEEGNGIAQPEKMGSGLYNYYNKDELERQGEIEVPKGLVEMMKEAAGGGVGEGEYKDKNGASFYSVYRPIEIPYTKASWTVIIVQPTINMVMTVDSVFRNAILGGLIILLIVFGAITYFSDRMTQPIMQIVEMANRVRAGDLSGQLQITSQNEIGLLADNINHMIQGLRENREKTKQTEQRIRNIAYHDTLTGLPNRMHFMVYLREMLEKVIENRFYGALLFIDVDKFKTINDTYGHAIGDGLLIAFSKRIIEVVGRKEIACRYGGDEFLLFLPGYDYEDTKSTCERIVQNMREPFNISGNEFSLSTSIGAALFPKDANNIDELMRKADAALYKSKRSGRDQYNFYVEGMQMVNREN